MLVVVHENAGDEGSNPGSDQRDVTVYLGIIGGDMMPGIQVAVQSPDAECQRQHPHDDDRNPTALRPRVRHLCRILVCAFCHGASQSPVRRSMELFDDAEGPIRRNPGCPVAHPSLNQGVLGGNH